MKLRIVNLHASVSLGVYEWEKKGPRPVIINVEAEYDSGRSAQTDRLEDTLDYAMLEQRILEIGAARHYHLIESLVAAIGQGIMAFPAIAVASVEVSKPEALEHAETVTLREEFRR